MPQHYPSNAPTTTPTQVSALLEGRIFGNRSTSAATSSSSTTSSGIPTTMTADYSVPDGQQVTASGRIEMVSPYRITLGINSRLVIR